MLLAQELSVDTGRRTAALHLDSGGGGGGGGQCQLALEAGVRGAWATALRRAFLPEGYPRSVTPDYLGYQVWDSVQALATYVRGILSSQAVLQGVGVGSAAATPLSAVSQFLVRDLAGMLGGVLFATAQGSSLDAHAKQWRLFADTANDLGLALELAPPLFPSAFLLMACMGSLARAVTGVAGGATRTALTQHFALSRNAADISAKEGSQETATTAAGMLLGLALSRWAAALAGKGAAAAALIWGAFVALTALHIAANVWAMRCLRLTSLNRPRVELLLRQYAAEGKIASPEEVAAQETLLAPPVLRALEALHLRRRHPRVLLGPPLASLDASTHSRLAGLLAEQVQQRRRRRRQQQPPHFLLLPVGRGGEVQDMAVLLQPGSTQRDVLQAYCAALLQAWRPNPAGGVATASSSSGSFDFERFAAALEAAGWATDRVALAQGISRLRWGEACAHGIP